MAGQSKEAGWIVPSVQCIVLYGLWGFFSKLGGQLGLEASQESLVQKIGLAATLPFLSYIDQMTGGAAPAAAAAGAAVASSVPLLQRPVTALLASFLSGSASCVASLYYSKAMEVGDGGTVSAVTACYPPVTMILGAIFLGEVKFRSFFL